MRAVFDSNIFVSSITMPGGRADKAILTVAEGKAELVISKPIIHEVLGVLARKFDRNPEELARVAVFLSELGEVVSPRKKVKALSDDPDSRVLECALTGQADVIVTGDQAMLALGQYEGIKIVSLKEFLEP